MRIERPFQSSFNLLVRKSPVEVQLVVTRRCNLSCGYCREYDQHSDEVPLEELKRRIDAIHRLRAQNIALLGGEPLLHSGIDDVIRHARQAAQVSVTTNGFLLDEAMIARLNAAGLANLQLSVDAVKPDKQRYLQKTLHSVAPKLDRLAAHARFDVHIAIVLCRETLPEVQELSRELKRWPFRVALNIVHDDQGQALVAGPEYEAIWKEHYASGRPFSFIEEEYGQKLLAGERPDWLCRAGSRFIYVDEFGQAELCSGQRGRTGKSILDYTLEDLDAYRNTPKGCEQGCSILCAYRDSQVDNDPMALGKALFKLISQGGFRGGELDGAGADGGSGRPRRRLPLVTP